MIWLVQRSQDAGLMPGMWELPEVPLNGHKPLASFKHSILNTNYKVAVLEFQEPTGTGHWVRYSRLPKLALTGLTRKVLRHFALL
jgi:A/G-specific adenine glycosylase